MYYLGNKNLLKEKKKIAVVGSREMSAYGKKMIEKFVPELVKKGFVIVSGMAFGVDAWVHKIALDSGGYTIAVLGGGVDRPTPYGNKWIYDRILSENGLIMSKFRNGTIPRPVNFLQRNEIVVDLVSKVLVIEGDNHSGALVTAKIACDKGKDVYCIPGRIGDINSFTPNFLIKNGAEIVMEGSDII